MKLAAEVGIARLCKDQEELCGDATDLIRDQGTTTVILSDGLGSGVKASILATLTTRITSGLLRRHVSMEHVIQTIADTLPICKVRGLAYATLAVLQVDDRGHARLYEYDSPEIMLLRGDQLIPLRRTERLVAGRLVCEASFDVQQGDLLLMVSDGVIHAGVGGLFDLGLGQAGLMEYLPNLSGDCPTADEAAAKVIRLAHACYLGKAGDDCTAIAVKIRPPQMVTVLTGPAQNPADDETMVRDFLARIGSTRIVCGGTTAQIVGRVLGCEMETSLDYPDPRVPPVAYLRGIDLTTEGILTLNRTYEILRSALDGEPLPNSEDGATLMAKRLLNAEDVLFLVGRGINPAQVNLEQLVHLAPRAHVVDKITKMLRRRGTEVEIRYY